MYDHDIEKPAALSKALLALKRYDHDKSFRDSVLAQAQSLQMFSDSVGLPEGSLQKVMPTVYEINASQFFVNGIPLNPLQAAGVDKITYPRVTYNGEMQYTQSDGFSPQGRVDIGLENVELATKRTSGHFIIGEQESDQIAYFVSQGNVAGAINLLQQRREAAVRAWLEERDTVLSIGRPSAGLIGIMNSVDVEEIPLSTGLNFSNTPDVNLAVLSMMSAAIVERTKGTFSPSTLVLPPSTLEGLQNQPRAATSDKTVLKFFQETRGNVAFDGGLRPFEIVQSSKLNNFRPGFDGAIMMCRSLACLEQFVPKNITYSSPIYQPGGYMITFHGEVCSIAIKQPKSLVRVVWPNGLS